jgi:hypothetical protein
MSKNTSTSGSVSYYFNYYDQIIKAYTEYIVFPNCTPCTDCTPCSNCKLCPDFFCKNNIDIGAPSTTSPANSNVVCGQTGSAIPNICVEGPYFKINTAAKYTVNFQAAFCFATGKPNITSNIYYKPKSKTIFNNEAHNTGGLVKWTANLDAGDIIMLTFNTKQDFNQNNQKSPQIGTSCISNSKIWITWN